MYSLFLKFMYTWVLKVASRTKESQKLCLLAYLLKNNQVGQFEKFMILKKSQLHVCDLS